MSEKKTLDFNEIFSTSADLFAEVKYVCGDDLDQCLPFDEIIAKAQPEHLIPEELLHIQPNNGEPIVRKH